MNIINKYIFFVLLCVIFGTDVNAEKQNIPYKKVAKAVISKVLGANHASMHVEDYNKDGVLIISYIRDSDGTKWSQLVKFDGNTAIWASAGTPDEPNKIGRWRTSHADSVITFYINGNYVVIKEKFSDGSSDEKSYLLSNL